MLAQNWPIGICLHRVRTLLWFVPTMSTLLVTAQTKENYFSITTFDLILKTGFINSIQQVLSTGFVNKFCQQVLSIGFVNMFCQHVFLLFRTKISQTWKSKTTTTTKICIGLHCMRSQSKMSKEVYLYMTCDHSSSQQRLFQGSMYLQ